MKLADYGPGRTTGVDDKKDAHEQLDENRERLAQLQYMLYAESKKGLLIILQVMSIFGVIIFLERISKVARDQ